MFWVKPFGGSGSSRKRVKGQFFILGAFILSAMFFLGLPPTQPLTQTYKDDISYLRDNLLQEMPRALNFGINSSTNTKYLSNFSLFLINSTQSRFLNFSHLFVVTEPTDWSDTDSAELNITVGNYLNDSVTVTFSISGSTTSLSVGKNATGSTTMTPGSGNFNLTLSFNNVEKTILLRIDEVRLYSYIKLERGSLVSIGEVVA